MAIAIRDVRENELDSVLALNNAAGATILPLDAGRMRDFFREAAYFRVAEADGCLFIEGYEEYTDKRTGERIAHPYMGIMEFRDGKISKWRDYFEMNQKKKAE